MKYKVNMSGSVWDQALIEDVPGSLGQYQMVSGDRPDKMLRNTFHFSSGVLEAQHPKDVVEALTEAVAQARAAGWTVACRIEKTVSEIKVVEL